MKQASLKTFGVAAAGAALAAGAGTASASALTDSVAKSTHDIVDGLPVEETAEKLPGDSGEVVTTGAQLLTSETPLADDMLSHTSTTTSSATSNINGDLGKTANGLLGGKSGNLLGGLAPGSLGLDGLGG